MEHLNVVVRFTLELKSCTHRRTLWSGTCDSARRLVGHKVERRHLAESRRADDHVAAGWICFWRAPYVFAFPALHRFTPHFVNTLFGKLQIFSAAWMAHSHGSNDAQKTMGIIALALFTGTKAGSFDHLPSVLAFLKTPTFILPTWVVALCALTMAIGTAAGGWRIIRTLGHRMVKLQPVNGFAAETTAALIIQGASYYGIPLSTTHVITTSIMGVGAVKRFSGMRWTVVERIIWAWLFTLPASGLIGYALERVTAAAL
jgi:inorganic phosphate transporter, PiT family